MAFVGPALAHLPWLLTHVGTPVEKELIWWQRAFCPQLTIVNVSAPSKELCSRAHSGNPLDKSLRHEGTTADVMDPGNDKRSAGQREHSHAIDHRTHGEQNAAIGAYIRWRNSRAEPKTNFAPEPRSANGPITRPRLHDRPLAGRERAPPSAY
jgi:hypothetical protein